MWLLELILFLVTLFVAWTLYGYFIFIWFMSLFRQPEEPVFPDSWPAVSVIVPCYNEEGAILEKLENIRSLDYPHELLEVVFVDGGSSDRTVSLLSEAMAPGEPYSVVVSPCRGKIPQINHVLPDLSGEIVVNSDVDALLEPDTLKWLAAEFHSRPDVWVVGTYARPAEAMELDRYHWDSHNKGRFLETNYWSTSIVLAPCYAFKRELLKTFPEDVVADDIYIALLAMTEGRRAVLSRRAKSVETRGPRGMGEFLPHKYRKSNAFLREFLRFVYCLPQMNLPTRIIVMNRISQHLLLPWFLVLWGLLAMTMITMFRIDLAILSTVFLAFWAFVTSLIFARIELPDEKRRYPLPIVFQGYMITLVLLLLTGIGYPWFSQGSSYNRIQTPVCEGETVDPSRKGL